MKESFVHYLKRLQKELQDKTEERVSLIKKFNNKELKGTKVSSKNYNIIQNEIFHLQDILTTVKNSIECYKIENPKIK